MSTWPTDFEAALVSGEKLLAVVEDLFFNILFVPDISPLHNPQATLYGALALTNRRLIAAWENGNCEKWFSVSVLHSLSERPLQEGRPDWPYQAILMLPAGMGLVVQTSTLDEDHASKLCSLVVHALLLLGGQPPDTDTLPSLAALRPEP